MRKTSLKPLCLTILILALVVTSCNMPSGEQVITPDVTQAYQTVQARLTESALLSPSPTLTMTPAPTTAVPSPTEGTAAPSPTQRPPAQPTAAAVKQCDQAAPGSPIDVTIPDDTRLTPGQSFTKTWRLLNNGTCTWTREYTIALFSGEAMGAPAGVNLPNDVAPGGSVDISVTMVAPATAGTYRGDWKLRNASGTWFGIGPGAASTFWVKVVVAGTPGTPGTTAVTVTETPETPYPGGGNGGQVISGSAGMVPNDQIDLDTGSVLIDGGDMLYRQNEQGGLGLVPQGGTFAVMAFSQPGYNACKNAALSSGTMRIRDLQAGIYVCYRTDQGMYGWIKLAALEEATSRLSFQYNTWLNP